MHTRAWPPPSLLRCQVALLDGPNTVLTLRAKADVDLRDRQLVGTGKGVGDKG